MGKREGGRKPRGKTVKDLRNGKASDDYEVEIGEGHNSAHFEPSGKTLDEFFEQIDAEDQTIADIMEAARKKCQGSRKAITTAKKRMVKDGYHTKELETLMRKHRMARKLENVGKDLDEDQRIHFRKMDEAWQRFKDTPLGSFAEQHAEAALQD